MYNIQSIINNIISKLYVQLSPFIVITSREYEPWVQLH